MSHRPNKTPAGSQARQRIEEAMGAAIGADKETTRTTTIVLMGVSGAGKTTIMDALEARLGWPAAEGDSFHPAANVEKMRTGHPLTDEDRWPWLEALAAWIGEREAAGQSVLVSCSALKRSYRDLLRRGHPSVWFAHLVAPPGVIENRLEHRQGHYMPRSLLPSQLETLEPLQPDEPGARIEADGTPNQIVNKVLAQLASARAEREKTR